MHTHPYTICFQERCEGMSGRKFLYGTHYSAPGYVLYFLVRSGNRWLPCPFCFVVLHELKGCFVLLISSRVPPLPSKWSIRSAKQTFSQVNSIFKRQGDEREGGRQERCGYWSHFALAVSPLSIVRTWENVLTDHADVKEVLQQVLLMCILRFGV